MVTSMLGKRCNVDKVLKGVEIRQARRREDGNPVPLSVFRQAREDYGTKGPTDAVLTK
jgi:hypothetical protein